MQRWRGVEQTPPGWGRCVATIGVFDGVHCGHQRIIGRAVALAAERGVPSVVLTFDPHPSEILRPGSHPALLTGTRAKAELLEALGVDVMCVVPFTKDFSRLTPEEFVHEILVERLHVSAVVIGDNFRYGAKGSGDVEALRTAGQRLGFAVDGVALEGSGEGTYSSTYVRALIDAGEVRAAAEVLGREHRIEGLVVRGDQRGREIGYPTANLSLLPWTAVPADGIYAGHLVRGPHLLPAAISIGTNPTFAGRERRVEAFVLDFDGDLYGERVDATFTERLRPMVRFATVAGLVAQMDQDVQRTREILGCHPLG